jgi:precorrin-4 C11-methyltransferase
MKQSPTVVLIAVTKKGLEQARCLRGRLGSGTIYRPTCYGLPDNPWEKTFAGALSGLVPDLFVQFDQLVFFLATGAVVRLIASCLDSKISDPGVLAVDEAGQFVIPLLSGHKGGANAFARQVAGCLGAIPVVTTASDVLGGFSPDLLQEAFGWTAEPATRLKSTAMCLVNREPVAIIQEIGGRGCWLDEIGLPENVSFATDFARLSGRSYASILWVTDRVVSDFQGTLEERILWYRPKSLVLGVGCERGISLEALRDGLECFLKQHGFSKASISTLATVTVKADENAILELARGHSWQTVFYSPEELSQVDRMPNPSHIVDECIGTPGVAEPAALRAARAERLLVEKQIITSALSPRRMTFALARVSHFQERDAENGRVTFIGAGPGDPDLLTLKAHQALGKADVVVYAGSLVPEQILRRAPGQAALHNSAHLTLEQVMDVMRTAVRSGKRVVRLQSGDTSLYSAIGEQIALLEEAAIDSEVIPGISSFQAAAAALKCELTLPEIAQTVILTRSEGKTRMPEMEGLESLAQHRATLCIFLSAHFADTVQERLLRAYSPDTPVAIVYRVTWPDEKIIKTRLDQLGGEIRKNKLSRTTLILVGAATGGRRNRSRLYDKNHGHLFRTPSGEEDHPSP